MTAVLRRKAAAGRVVASRPVTTATGESKYLTKTRFVNGLACSKWLWLAFNAPDRLPKIDESVRYRLDEGRLIGELARRRYPEGTLLPAESPLQNEKRSRKLLDKRVPLFEAGFTHPNGTCYARADVLLPVGRNGWDLVEVKSGGSVKEEYIDDVAFQRYCYTGAGLKIRKYTLLLVDTKYERSGEIDPAQFFHEEDVTDAVKQVAPTVQPNVDTLLEVAHSKESPEFGRGERFHKDEYGVHSDDVVWKEHPASDILDLYGGGKKVLQLLEAGVFRIQDIPKGVVLTGKQVVQRAAHTSGRTHVDRKKIATFLGGLRYPLHFLDFETIFPAVPSSTGPGPTSRSPSSSLSMWLNPSVTGHVTTPSSRWSRQTLEKSSWNSSGRQSAQKGSWSPGTSRSKRAGWKSSRNSSPNTQNGLGTRRGESSTY